MRRLAIFDFDGTAVNTLTDVALCFNEALKLNGFAQHPLEAFAGFVGGNLETVVSKMLPRDQVTEENISAVKTVYRSIYLNSAKPHTRPYPGMCALMDELREKGIKIAVNSNKGQALLDDMVESIFPKGYFSSVIGYDEKRPSKPSPWGVDAICRECGCTREDAVYIGDGKSDIDTAANAGIPCVFVTWGQGTDRDMADARVTAIAHDVAELREILLSDWM